MELCNLRGIMVCLSTLKSPQDIELPHYHHIFFFSTNWEREEGMQIKVLEFNS